MRKIIIAFLLIVSTQTFAQDNDLKVCVGVAYSPNLCYIGNSEFSGLRSSYSPVLELSLGVDGLNVYSKMGNSIEFGVRFGNGPVMTGIGYALNYQTNDNQRHVAFAEIGYDFKIKKNLYLYLSSKCGVTINDTMLSFSPISASLRFVIN
jgi:hypothetical protein